MRRLTGISSEPKQRHQLVIDGSTDKVSLTLEYRSDLYAWFFSAEWGTFSVNNERLNTDFNILRQHSRVLPFGISCDSLDGTDPMFVDSFSSGNCILYQLDAADIDSGGVYFG
jgi:hypothetical protein